MLVEPLGSAEPRLKITDVDRWYAMILLAEVHE